MEFHAKELSLRCRVCGRRVSARKNAPVQTYTDELLVIHGIDLREDDIHRHPQLLCGGCVMHMQRATRSESMSGSFAQSLLTQQDEWPACSGGSCPLCDRWKKELKGGKRPKPARGHRPKQLDPMSPSSSEQSAASSSQISASMSILLSEPAASTMTEEEIATALQHLDASPFQSRQLLFVASANHPLTPGRFVPLMTNEFFICEICKDVLQQPLFVPPPNGCEHRCCRNCWLQWLSVSFSCPVCKVLVRPEDLSVLSRHEWLQLCSLQLHCDYEDRGCKEVVTLEQLRHHVSVCPYEDTSLHRGTRSTQPAKQVSPTPQNTVNPLLKDIIDAPSTRPLSREEDMVLGSLLHRKSQQLGTQVAIPVYTGGRPRHVSFVTKAAASTGDMPSLRTMARRHQAAMQLEEVISGDAQRAQEQRSFNLQRLSKDDWRQLLFSAKLSHRVSREDTMAMALHLRLTNEQQRKLRLWTRQWHVQLSSEREVRKLASERMGSIEVACEMVQALDEEDESGTRNIQPSPFAWVRNIITRVAQQLEPLHKNNQLTWHD